MKHKIKKTLKFYFLILNKVEKNCTCISYYSCRNLHIALDVFLSSQNYTVIGTHRYIMFFRAGISREFVYNPQFDIAVGTLP